MPSSQSYATAAEIRASMDAASSDDDTQFTALALAASRMIDGYCGRAEDGFVASATASARIYPGSGQRWMWIDEALSITQVKVKNSVSDVTYDNTLASGGFRGFRGDPRSPSSINFNKTPYHGIMLTSAATVSRWLEGSFVDNRFYYYNDRDASLDYAFEPTVEITAKWGWGTAVPPIIKQATIMQAIRLYKRQQGGMADALITAEFGQSRFLSEIDKDVKALLSKSRLIRPNFGGR